MTLTLTQNNKFRRNEFAGLTKWSNIVHENAKDELRFHLKLSNYLKFSIQIFVWFGSNFSFPFFSKL